MKTSLFSISNRLRALYFLSNAIIVAWSPTFSTFLSRSGIKGWQIGVLTGIAPFIVLFIQPLWAYLADSIGKQRFLIFSTLIVGTSFLFYAENQPFATLAFITLCVTLFHGCIGLLLDSVILDHIEVTGHSYGRFRIWGVLGWSVTAFIMGISMKDASYITYFRIAAGLTFAFGLICFSILRVRSTSKTELPSYDRKGVFAVFANVRLFLFLVVVFFHSITTACLWTHQGLLLEELGASNLISRLAFSLQALIEVPFLFFADNIIRRIGLPRALAACFATMIIRLFLYSICPNAVMTLPVETLQGLSWGLFWVCCVEFINRYAGAQWRATGQSILCSIYWGIGLILGNLISGSLLDYFKIQQIFLMSSGLLALCSLVLFPILLRHDDSPEQLATAGDSQSDF